ncbi:MAG: cation-translocating P-type ATPase [Planctomycetia bacterium]|nr:cation-translocating P-type ATPase [Planctomycetia bacterium]
MSTDFVNPVSSRMNDLEVPLTISERIRIAAQLGSALLAGGLLIVGLLEKYYGPPGMSDVADLIIMLAAIIVSTPIFCTAVAGVFSRSADTHAMTEQLVALATLAAMMTGSFIVATLIPIIMNLSHFLEERSILGAQAAIDGLKTLQARDATIITAEGEEKNVLPSELHVGDILLIRPGDVIAADGDVLEGFSTIDQSSITGESVPEEAQSGSNVFAGTMNLTGVLRVRVTKTGEKTAFGRVVSLLKEAEQSKTPVMKLIEKYAAYYVPIIITVAGVVLFLTEDISRAVTVLVVACPGAIVLAGPTAMIAALAAASRLGILIKNTRFLESVADIDTVVLDKTGTVTIGHLELSRITPIPDADETVFTEDEILTQALRCALGSRHPVSRAIVTAAEAREIKLFTPPASGTQEVPGKGVLLQEGSETTYLGRLEWLKEEDFDVSRCTGISDSNTAGNLGSVTWLGVRYLREDGSEQKRVLGCFLLADRPRPEAREAIRELRDLGVENCILLTGDRRSVAEEIGRNLEVDQVIAEVLPSQKLDVVSEEKEKGHLVMMVGDGVNDAPALASGDVGIALGAVASDIALQSADIALMTNDLRRIPMTMELARRTRFTIHTNILVGVSMSFFFMWLASIAVISPLLGALLHVVGEAFVIINSARLLQFGTDS